MRRKSGRIFTEVGGLEKKGDEFFVGKERRVFAGSHEKGASELVFKLAPFFCGCGLVIDNERRRNGSWIGLESDHESNGSHCGARDRDESDRGENLLPPRRFPGLLKPGTAQGVLSEASRGLQG